MSTDELQAEIKRLIAKLSWSQHELAKRLYFELDEDGIDDEIAIVRFQEKLKKELARPTTKPERLQRYLEIIQHDSAYKKINEISPCYRQSDELSQDFIRKMKDISKALTEKIAAKIDGDGGVRRK